MTIPPNFNNISITKLAKRTDYEAWLLEAVYAIVENELFPTWPDGVIYPVNQLNAQFFVHGHGHIAIGDWRPGFINAGAPLVFVSTFKLLDMLVEWVLEENGFQYTYSFKQKLKNLNEAPIFPQLIESRTWLKERLIGLYSTLEPFRGTIIHDKHFTVTDGTIRVASSKNCVIGIPVVISASQLRTLARTIVAVLRYIDGAWHLDEFREKMLRHDLDELTTLHGLPSLGQRPPFHTCVRVYTTHIDPLLVNPVIIQKDLATRYVNQDCSFDLRILMVRDGKVSGSYLFPWTVIDPNAGWSHAINAERYRAPTPDDIKPEHLQHEQGQ